MADGITVRTEGMTAALAMAQDLPGAFGYDIQKAGLQKVGRAIVKEARARINDRSGTLSGALMTKVERRPDWDGKTLRGRAGVRLSRRGGPGTYAPHGHLVEFGTAPHILVPEGESMYIHGSGVWVSGPIRHPGAAPRPFLRPAIEAVTPRAADIMANDFKKRVPKVRDRLARNFARLSKRDRRLLGE